MDPLIRMAARGQAAEQLWPNGPEKLAMKCGNSYLMLSIDRTGSMIGC